MKLITNNGHLDLPQDFSLTIERTNPFLSGEGDSSVPATLPASENNLATLGHLERIDRATRYKNKVDAILQVGPVQKRGSLVIDTVHRQDGIDASLAIDSSDLYVKAKAKTLKEIFAEYDDGEGYKQTFTDLATAMATMQDIYHNGSANSDYVIFPVAIAAYETGDDDEKTTVYQFNNEVDDNDDLVYAERVVREGDIQMLVPEGYGIAPFLKLGKLLDRLFECLDYTVTANCFNDQFYDKIVIVHNCSDALVRPVLNYADLVPSCTLSEFLEWLLAKFHVQPVVDSEAKEVRIARMESLINRIVGGYDMDISSLAEGDFTMQLNPSKRIVLTPTYEIEGTEPAEETFDKLLSKYGFYVDVSEAQFASLTTDSPAVQDCLIRRKASGMFYLLERRLDNGNIELHELGSNYFTYDRQNSDETEDFSQGDLLPRMWVGDNYEVAPYIGERIHRHTSYKGSVDDSEQPIIVVQALTSKLTTFATSGTTQKDIPLKEYPSTETGFSWGLDNYSLQFSFWNRYNTLLLNNPVHLIGRLKLGIAQFLGMDMSKLKLCRGQRLLPVKASASLSEKIGLTEVEFINSEFAHGDGDTNITPSPAPTLKWTRATYDENGDPFDEAAFCRRLYQDVVDSQEQIYPYYNAEYIGYYVDYEDYDNKAIWLGTPREPGETRTFVSEGHYHIIYEYDIYNGSTFVRRVRTELPNQYTLNPEDYDHFVRIVFTAVYVGQLPYDAEVEYIRSNGTQYINTGILPTQDIEVECKWQRQSASGQYYLFGGGTTTSNSIRAYSGSTSYWRYGNGKVSLGTNDTDLHVSVMNKNGVVHDNVSYPYDVAVPNFSSDEPILLFWYSGTNSAASRIPCDMVNSKIRNNGVLVRDYIPVRVGNKGYLYDRLSGQLYGSETEYPFAAGPDKQQ